MDYVQNMNKEDFQAKLFWILIVAFDVSLALLMLLWLARLQKKMADRRKEREEGEKEVCAV